jgi:hypothetical protein
MRPARHDAAYASESRLAKFAIVVGFKHGKISHEHIYWDRASVLVQLGLLDPAGLPVVGAEGARKVLDPKQARRMGRALAKPITRLLR